MKKIMSLVLAVTLVMSVFGGLTAFAADAARSIPAEYTVVEAVADGNDAYGWKIDGTTLYVYYPGNKKVFTKDDYTSRPWQDSAEKITKVVIDGTPTEIGDYTFYQMSNLAEVTFAGTETIINPCAFADTAISGVFTIPAHITRLHGQAFMNCPINILIFDGNESSEILYLRKGLQYLGNLTNIIIKRKIGFSDLSAARTLNEFCGTYANGKHGMTNPARINVIAAKSSYYGSFKNLTAYTGTYDTTLNNAKTKEHSVAPALFGECDVFDATKGFEIDKFIDNVWYLKYTKSDGTKTVEFITNDCVENGTNLANGDALNSEKGTFGKMVFGFGFTQIPEKFGNEYKALEELKLPTTMEKIGNFAFDGVDTMVKANFEDTKITDIGVASFRKSKFKELKFPSTLSQIKQKAFINNNVLECVYFPKASNLFLGNLAFAREKDNSSYVGKNLKVIFDEVTSFDDSTKDDTFAADTTSSTDWRTTTIVYNSKKTTSLPNFNQVTKVEDVYYEVSDTDKDNINLFMCNFADKQDYKLFMCTYANNALDSIHMINEGTLAKGEFINAEFNTSANVEKGNTKVFLWEGFANCKPLKTVLEK